MAVWEETNWVEGVTNTRFVISGQKIPEVHVRSFPGKNNIKVFTSNRNGYIFETLTFCPDNWNDLHLAEDKTGWVRAQKGNKVQFAFV